MAKYFRYFPTTYYSTGNNLDTVTNITSRFSFEKSFKENSSVYYEYDIQESDTPEVIAAKIYDNPERHWIILLFNDIVDPQYDWPLQYNTLINFIDSKYTANADTANNETGLEWAQSNTKEYIKIITRTSSDGTEIIEKLNLDANTYANVSATSTDYTLQDGYVVTETITKETKTYYEYEVEENENKRTIKILKPELLTEIEKEFKRVIS